MSPEQEIINKMVEYAKSGHSESAQHCLECLKDSQTLHRRSYFEPQKRLKNKNVFFVVVRLIL